MLCGVAACNRHDLNTSTAVDLLSIPRSWGKMILDARQVDAPAGVTQKGHTAFLHLPSAVLALTFITRRIQSSLSLVDCEVVFCVQCLRINRSLLLGIKYKIPVRVNAPRFELTSQRQKVSRLPTGPPGRPAKCTTLNNNCAVGVCGTKAIPGIYRAVVVERDLFVSLIITWYSVSRQTIFVLPCNSCIKGGKTVYAEIPVLYVRLFSLRVT